MRILLSIGGASCSIVKGLGGRGFLFVIRSGTEFVDPKEAEAFLKVLTQEGMWLAKSRF
jgi:hypothetical protein